MRIFSTKVWKNNQPTCSSLFPVLTVVHVKVFPVLFRNFCIWFAYQCRRSQLAKTNTVLQMSASYEPSSFAAISRELQYHLIYSLLCQTIMEGYFPMHLVTAGCDDKAIYNKWSLLSYKNTAWLLSAAEEGVVLLPEELGRIPHILVPSTRSASRLEVWQATRLTGSSEGHTAPPPAPSQDQQCLNHRCLCWKSSEQVQKWAITKGWLASCHSLAGTSSEAWVFPQNM